MFTVIINIIVAVRSEYILVSLHCVQLQTSTLSFMNIAFINYAIVFSSVTGGIYNTEQYL